MIISDLNYLEIVSETTITGAGRPSKPPSFFEKDVVIVKAYSDIWLTPYTNVAGASATAYGYTTLTKTNTNTTYYSSSSNSLSVSQ
jgi:hypothetical protein